MTPGESPGALVYDDLERIWKNSKELKRVWKNFWAIKFSLFRSVDFFFVPASNFVCKLVRNFILLSFRFGEGFIGALLTLRSF